MEGQSNNPYLEMSDGDDFSFKGWERIFDESFLSYYELLLKRGERLQELDKDSLDWKTYRDLCLVMIRAMLIESERLRANYTLQNFLSHHDRNDLVEKVNSFLQQKINSLMSLREALKIAVDKFIAHNDSIVGFDQNGNGDSLTDVLFKRHIFLSDLNNDSYPFTIRNIIEFIQAIITEINLPVNVTQNSLADVHI